MSTILAHFRYAIGNDLLGFVNRTPADSGVYLLASPLEEGLPPQEEDRLFAEEVGEAHALAKAVAHAALIEAGAALDGASVSPDVSFLLRKALE